MGHSEVMTRREWLLKQDVPADHLIAVVASVEEGDDAPERLFRGDALKDWLDSPASASEPYPHFFERRDGVAAWTATRAYQVTTEEGDFWFSIPRNPPEPKP